MPNAAGKLLAFVKKNTVLCVALAAALVTMVLVPPDGEYLGYFDLKTLTCLFCVLAVVGALKNIRFFYILAEQIVRMFGNARLCVLSLCCITFVGSMLIANDMALLTFLPLGYYILSTTGQENLMAYVFILQNIAANLGGMLTPFGNPQNLYLYSYFEIPAGEFMQIMLPPFLLAVAMIMGACLLVPKTPMVVKKEECAPLPKGRTAVYLVLFAWSIAIVFRGIPYWTGLIVIPLALLFLDRKALKTVDYPLLCTFACFFVFSGNLARLEPVREFFGAFLERDTLLYSTLSCQVISNVPSAVLLARFTDNFRELLWGVNIGGTGTLIASLASLITFREYQSHNKGFTRRYLLLFTLMNLVFLVVLFAFCCILR